MYQVLVGKPEGKTPAGRPGHRWEDDIKINLKGVGLEIVNYLGLAHDRDNWRAFMNTGMSLWIHKM
jgi:hypothetical protein